MSRRNIVTILVSFFVLLGFLVSVFGLLGCTFPQDISNLPPKAENVIILGNGWTYFDLDGNKFMHHKSYRLESITQVH